MAQIAATRKQRRRYNWCPGCRELWVAACMAERGVSTCPSCQSVVLAYVGRSPYDDAAPNSEGMRAAGEQ